MKFFSPLPTLLAERDSEQELVLFLKKNGEIIAAIKLEKCVASICLFCIIICKFCYGQELCPVNLLLINESLEISLYYTVLPFDVAISLWIEGGRKLSLNAKKIV